jgi:hypothetical protein
MATKKRSPFGPTAGEYTTEQVMNTPGPVANPVFQNALNEVVARILSGSNDLSGFGLDGSGGSGAARRRKQNAAIMNIFNRRQGEANKFYAGQEKQATGTINKAMEDFLASLGGPTAYQNAPVPNLPQTQMGLLAQLQQYGASPEMAQAQQATDAAYAQQMQDIFNRSNQQMQGTDEAFYKSLQAGARGGQAQSLMALANLMAGLRAQTQSETAGARDELLLRALGL